MADGNNNEGSNFDDLIKTLLSQAASGGSYVPGQTTPTSRSAIGVEGKQVIDPLTGKVTGYTGYLAPARSSISPYGPGGKVTPQPLYFTGDEDTINKYSREDIAFYQAQMKANGFMSGTYTPGVVDNKTRSAFRNVLGVANRMGSDWQTALASVGQARQEAGITGTGLRTYQITNPDDLKAVFRKTAQEMLGRNLQDGDLNALVSSFQQEQVRYQQQAQTVGGVVTQAPSAETFASTRISQDFGQEVDTRKMDRLFSVFDRVVSEGK